MPDALRWLLWFMLAATLAVSGLLLGLRVAGPTERDTQLGTVSLRVAPGLNGTVDAFIPLANWGVRAEPFSAPLVVHVEPRTIDRQAVIRASGGDRGVLAAAQRDAQQAARDALLRALLWGLGVAAAVGVVAALLLRRRWLGVAVIGLAAAAGGLTLLQANRTFSAEAFEAPQFYARGAELAQLLKVAGRAQRQGKEYRSQVDRTLSSYASLLRAGGTAGLAPAGRPAVVISDLHANTLVLDAVERLATGSPVFFPGDFAQSGTEAEANALVGRITGLGEVVAVSGNHDSSLFMDRLEDAGATVLRTEDPPRRIAGLLVAGFSDPLESRAGDPNDPDRIYSFSELPDFRERWEAAKVEVVTWFRALTPRPDVVLIHHSGLAKTLAQALHPDDGPPLLILTGHDHIQHVDRHGQTLIVNAGTVGAGGILGARKDPIGVAQLELADGAWPRVIDLVQLEPFSGRAQADRILPASPDLCEGGVVECHDADAEEVEEPVDPPEE